MHIYIYLYNNIYIYTHTYIHLLVYSMVTYALVNPFDVRFVIHALTQFQGNNNTTKQTDT